MQALVSVLLFNQTRKTDAPDVSCLRTVQLKAAARVCIRDGLRSEGCQPDARFRQQMPAKRRLPTRCALEAGMVCGQRVAIPILA